MLYNTVNVSLLFIKKNSKITEVFYNLTKKNLKTNETKGKKPFHKKM